jgi:hypothetical protein
MRILTTFKSLLVLGAVVVIGLLADEADAGAFSVVVSENPPLTVEGIATPRGDGTADVQSAWILDSSPRGVQSLPLRGSGDDSWVQINLYMIANIDPLTGQVTSYTKWAVLDIYNINYPDSPVPNGISLMNAMAPGNSGGWSWSGFVWAGEDEIMDSIGGEVPTISRPSPCENITQLENDTRQLINLGNGLWLLIVVRADGSVHMLVYEQDPETGCWQIAFYPNQPGGPGYPGNPVGGVPMPPDHTFDESMRLLWHAWLVHLAEGDFIEIPGYPIGDPN